MNCNRIQPGSFTTRQITVLLVFACLAFFTLPSLAADISRDVREGREDKSIESGGYIEFSRSIRFQERVVSGADLFDLPVSIGGHYRYKRFFIDALAESYNQFQFGLSLYSGPSWSFDVLGAVSDDGIDSELNKELEEFTSRDPALNIGLRATGYEGPYIMQLEALHEASDIHDGYLVTASIARTWLYRNWNFHALLGARYQSQETLDYIFGIDEDEATAQFPVYEAGDGTTFVTEIGATYPINEFLVFKATGRWWELPDAAFDSPFIIRDSYATLLTSLTLVY